MTSEQVEQATGRLKKYSVGLLGTSDKPSQLAQFLENYIELYKEATAMSEDVTAFQRNKAKLDALLMLTTDMREFEKQHKEEEHERYNQ